MVRRECCSFVSWLSVRGPLPPSRLPSVDLSMPPPTHSPTAPFPRTTAHTELNKNPPEGVSVGLVDDNLFEWELLLVGPADTLYEVWMDASFCGLYIDVCMPA